MNPVPQEIEYDYDQMAQDFKSAATSASTIAKEASLDFAMLALAATSASTIAKEASLDFAMLASAAQDWTQRYVTITIIHLPIDILTSSIVNCLPCSFWVQLAMMKPK